MKKIVLQAVVCLGLSSIAVGGYYLKQYYDLKEKTEQINEKRAIVTLVLIDPIAAQFRNEIMNEAKWLCGEINSKNAYGAYTGFKRFIAIDSTDAYIEDIGSVGRGKGNYYNSYLGDYVKKQIQREIEMINYRKENGMEAPFKSLTIEDRNLELFEEQWKSNCH